MQSAKLVRQPKPIYPPLAKQARIQGTVRFTAVIGKDGTIRDLTADQRPPSAGAGRSGSRKAVGLPADAPERRAGGGNYADRRELHVEPLVFESGARPCGRRLTISTRRRKEKNVFTTSSLGVVAPGRRHGDRRLGSPRSVVADGMAGTSGRYRAVHHVGMVDRCDDRPADGVQRGPEAVPAVRTGSRRRAARRQAG